MLQGSIFKGLLAIAISIMLMNVVQALFNVVDMTVRKVFDTGDGYAVDGVGNCGMLISLVMGLVIGISAGSNVIVAKHIGHGEKESTERAVGAPILALYSFKQYFGAGLGEYRHIAKERTLYQKPPVR